MNITKKTSTHNTTAKTNRTIKYIVIHYTAGITSKSGSAANTASYFSTTKNEASADFIVDDANVIQYNPDLKNRYCWHCGGSKYSTKGGILYGVCTNSNSIGIEICSTNSTGQVKNANDSTWSFTDAAIAKAVELTKYLMKTYNITVANVVRHYDTTGKLCPGIIGWNKDSGDETKWNAFKSKLSGTTTTKKEENKTTTSTNTSSSTYTTGMYKVNVNSLNIRKGPGTDYVVVGCIKDKGTYTITEIKNGSWGRLKSGAGWINVHKNYCTKSATASSNTSTSKKTTTSTKKSNEEVAKEVLQGKWGNGSERKKKLEAAGYNYSSVQSIVNKLCK